MLSFSKVQWLRRVLIAIAAPAMLLILAGHAEALPAFAGQTGQTCQTCHVGGFGPQLTPYGRLFKLNGYTMRSGPINVPLAVMAVASYLRTDKDQPPPSPPHFGANDNLALDQVSLFLAGGLGSHFGGFAQVTYDGVGRAWTWDNLDLRAVAPLMVKGHSVVLGASLNNNPTLQDPWNTLPAWGYPYTSSVLAPSAPAAPLIAGGLAQKTLGVTGYAWIDASVYLEGGAYVTPGAGTLKHLGADPLAPGDIDGAAPYGRIAVQRTLGAHTLEAGLFFLEAGIFPGRDHSAGASDSFRDLGVDASDHWVLASGDVITLNARYTDERQRLAASQPLGLAANRDDSLTDVRADASYYWRNQMGGEVQVFDTSGSSDALLYASARTFRPDTTGVMLQIDGTPFGGAAQPMRRLNVRAGVQYVIYTRFEGAGANFDGAGRRASDNNTLRFFTWFAF
jgi:hypothetical protein